jgi:5-methylcytosine-specific restriction protein A
MENLLREPIENYLVAKEGIFAGNELADKLRKGFPQMISGLLTDKIRYKVIGSPGKGNWTDCPWIAILDTLITKTPQSGYYPVFIFKADMTGVYLSLNQGVTEVKGDYKRETKNVLRIRADDFRAKIDIKPQDLLEINLESDTPNAKLYEAGNIVARYYEANKLPNSESLRTDILYFLKLYEELSFNDNQIDEEKGLTAIERKQYRLHFRIERNSSISKKVKEAKGYICEACNFDFRTKYGDLGKNFIEAHHLIPISSLDIGQYQINILKDFAVLCSNCHSMIHRLENPSNIELLKSIVNTAN